MELHVELALEALLGKYFKSLAHVVNDCVINLQIVAGAYCRHEL